MATLETFGRYRLVERIGVGGMAEVFRASYSPTEGFDKHLVLKRILPHLSTNERFVKMFRDEAAITVHLSHNNIVQVFDFGEVDGVYFLAMEYVRGHNLREILEHFATQGRRLPLQIVPYIGLEIARGLAYAHSATDSKGRPLGIVHRDLNPPNVLISVEGEVKITDFGIARAARRLEQTEAGRVKGKVAYIAPEVLGAQPPDHRADLWALGCVIYEMLTGQPPYGREKEFEVPTAMVPKILSDPVPPLNRSEVPEALVRVVETLLAKDPSERPLSADEAAILLGSTVTPGARRLLQQIMHDEFPQKPLQEPASLAGDRSISGWNQGTEERRDALDRAISDSLSTGTHDSGGAASSAPSLSGSGTRGESARSSGPRSERPEPPADSPGIPWVWVVPVAGVFLLLAIFGLWKLVGHRPAVASDSPTPVQSAAPTPEGTQTAAATSTGVVHTPRPGPTERKVAVAMAVVSAPSGAEVRVNNKLVGKTPTSTYVQPGALVHVQVSEEGRKPYIDIVKVPTDADGFTVEASLEPLQYGVLEVITSFPSRISVNGASHLGVRTRHRLRLVEATHTVLLESDARGLRCEVRLTVTAKTTTTRRVDLASCTVAE